MFLSGVFQHLCPDATWAPACLYYLNSYLTFPVLKTSRETHSVLMPKVHPPLYFSCSYTVERKTGIWRFCENLIVRIQQRTWMFWGREHLPSTRNCSLLNGLNFNMDKMWDRNKLYCSKVNSWVRFFQWSTKSGACTHSCICYGKYPKVFMSAAPHEFMYEWALGNTLMNAGRLSMFISTKRYSWNVGEWIFS